MNVPSFLTAVPTTLRELGALPLPDWVHRVSGLASPVGIRWGDGIGVGACNSRDFARVSVKIANAIDLGGDALQKSVRLAYRKLFEQLAATTGFYPVRFWNFIPGINDSLERQQTRYMIFNAGRFLAFKGHYGEVDLFDRNVATASGVGHRGNDLWIHCLASQVPGVHLGNPRQLSPHNYSARFGRMPPCFARATRLRDQIFIAGTASIRGEESLHDELGNQLAETLTNLACVTEAASVVGPAACRSQANWLAKLTDVRVYHPRPADAPIISQRLRERLGGRPRLEFIHADLCRSELLVEIEALADLSERTKQGVLQ